MQAMEFPSEPDLPFSWIPELPDLPFSWTPKRSALRRFNALYRDRRSPLPTLLRDPASASALGGLLLGLGSSLSPRHSSPLDSPTLLPDPSSAPAGRWAGALCQGRRSPLAIWLPNPAFTSSPCSVVIVLSFLYNL
ncbi:hypothetical protein EUGRSUZ_K02391 [Eucalyptus grandis]|uniref:Uncharacterized protein n=2 Tax=Eucalyptus grandis TaxID=71139 RepID=A0ACC3IXT5_EUCGR|nr:hypothetical protein EUGRSUZ_K02391 [Eucalyptus grandis]